jgi:hypothetical protein
MASEPPLPKTPLYEASLTHIPPAFSSLLTHYAHIPPTSQIPHVLSLRNRAYASHPYPCLGRFRFMDLDLSNHPCYPSILSRLKSPDHDQELLLDFGCCIGQDLRKLLLDGAPVSKLYGSDLLPEFIATGYDLFCDKSTFPDSHFVAPADAFDQSPGNALAHFEGRVSILHISAVFHLFGLDQQRTLARRCLKLLSHKTRCLVLGGQTANITAGEYPGANGKVRWRHNEESWARMWEEVAREFGGCEVESHSVLEVRQVGIRKSNDADLRQMDRSSLMGSNVIGLMEEGFRWMVWWTEVKFQP